MKIIEKYIGKTILKYFFLSLSTVIGMHLIITFFERSDDILENDMTLREGLIFIAAYIDFKVAIPICILLGVLVTFSLLAKNNELVALKSGGVSIYFILKPVLLLGLAFSILLFLFMETAVPVIQSKKHDIQAKVKKWGKADENVRQDAWVKGNRSIFHIDYFDHTIKTIYGVRLSFFDEEHNLIRRVDARKGVYQDGNWHLYDLMEQKLDRAKNDFDVLFHDEIVEPLAFLPDDIKRVNKSFREMGFAELRDYIKKIELEGYDSTGYRVALHEKIAFPLICLIMSLVGTGITAAKAKINRSIAAGIAYGVGLILFFLWFSSFCMALGYGGVLPPLLAVWNTNMVFLCIGILTLINAD